MVQQGLRVPIVLLIVVVVLGINENGQCYHDKGSYRPPNPMPPFPIMPPLRPFPLPPPRKLGNPLLNPQLRRLWKFFLDRFKEHGERFLLCMGEHFSENCQSHVRNCLVNFPDDPRLCLEIIQCGKRLATDCIHHLPDYNPIIGPDVSPVWPEPKPDSPPQPQPPSKPDIPPPKPNSPPSKPDSPAHKANTPAPAKVLVVSHGKPSKHHQHHHHKQNH